MKHLLHILLLLVVFKSTGQAQALVYDTIRLADATYYEGQKIQLGAGTSDSKNFSYINTGKSIDSLIALPAAWANETLTVEMLYRNEFGFVIVASPPHKDENVPYILIRVEHALLSRELMRPQPVTKEILASVAVL